MDLSGNLKFLNLADVLQLLGANGSSGVLRIICKFAPNPGVIYLVSGNPIDATNDKLTGLEALYSLFGWIEGEFEFTQQEVSTPNTINKSRMEILLEGLRRLDEGLIEKIGPVSFDASTTTLEKSPEIPLIIGPLVDYTFVVDEETYFEGEKIVESGKHGNWIWVLLEGAVDILKDSSQGPKTLLRLGTGSFVGSIASFLVQGNIRSATAVAVEKVQLGVLDSQSLGSEYATLSADFKSLLVSMDKRLKHASNRAIEENFNKGHFDRFIRQGKPLIRQGQREKRLFKILKGEAVVVRHTNKGYVPLANLYKGDLFGQFPFLDMGHEPQSASIFATPNLKISMISVEDLQREYNSLSQTFKNFIENVSVCISATTMLACGFSETVGENNSI